MADASQSIADHLVPASTRASVETEHLSVDASRTIATSSVLVCSRSRRLNGAAEETSALDVNLGSPDASNHRRFGRESLKQGMRLDRHEALLRQIGQIGPDMSRSAFGEN